MLQSRHRSSEESYNFEEEETLVAVFVSGALLAVSVYNLLWWHHEENTVPPHPGYCIASSFEVDNETVHIDMSCFEIKFTLKVGTFHDSFCLVIHETKNLYKLHNLGSIWVNEVRVKSWKTFVRQNSNLFCPDFPSLLTCFIQALRACFGEKTIQSFKSQIVVRNESDKSV